MDDICPITATRYSVKDLNLTIAKPWRPWYTPADEVINDTTIFIFSFGNEDVLGSL